MNWKAFLGFDAKFVFSGDIQHPATLIWRCSLDQVKNVENWEDLLGDITDDEIIEVEDKEEEEENEEEEKKENKDKKEMMKEKGFIQEVQSDLPKYETADGKTIDVELPVDCSALAMRAEAMKEIEKEKPFKP
ncbi:hypothetical protein L1987_32510 [Smallanthus sonchifolius]|uniref:Uncharacterized protein n=1 Tax=Smallanthus sonchifolius TaxID=185202 RepID=A0ACB9HQ55_9ASTR|nr:hypothetical protein L1987_32510 [Smallanthus sonchifolius]